MNYSRREEFMSYVSHGSGAVLSLVGMIYLVAVSPSADARISTCIFGLSMTMLYGASTLYHYLSNVKLKNIFQKIDHSAIFILIAGTYTPFMLLSIGGFKGWFVIILNWTLAIIGIGLEFQTRFRSKKLVLCLYIIMGWMSVIFIRTIYFSIPFASFVLLVAGGLLYTGGVMIYIQKHLRYTHPLWHLFVLAGSLCHYFSILLIVCSGNT